MTGFGGVAETRYAPCGDDSIAYQVFGEGPVDMVFMSAWFSHVDGRWEEPHFAETLRRFASFSRLMVFDRRGSGASDPMPGAEPTWEDWHDDIRAVMDAAGSERAAILGVGDSGPVAMLFAATYPARVSSLVLANTGACLCQADDYPFGLTEDEVERFIVRTKRSWGTGGLVDIFSPSMGGDQRYREWWARYQRMSASPGRSTKMARLIFDIDARRALETITVPTLILHRKDFRFFSIEHGRYLAEHIKGAKFIEVEGADGFIYLGNSELVADYIEEFVTGQRRAAEADRILATVLMTDMVGSTDKASELGDQRWRAVMDTHDTVVRSELSRYRGQLVRTTGDGMLATFDGPARGIRCASNIRDALGQIGVTIRSGLHTGEVEMRDGQAGGIAVHIGARIMAEARPGEILVSRTVKDLVTGSDIRFADRGLHTLKGLPQDWQLFAVSV
jgi:class 3 adenylate cyclase/pimeloyl-ACP methyl ester carboxylesterase